MHEAVDGDVSNPPPPLISFPPFIPLAAAAAIYPVVLVYLNLAINYIIAGVAS